MLLLSFIVLVDYDDDANNNYRAWGTVISYFSFYPKYDLNYSNCYYYSPTPLSNPYNYSTLYYFYYYCYCVKSIYYYVDDIYALIRDDFIDDDGITVVSNTLYMNRTSLFLYILWHYLLYEFSIKKYYYYVNICFMLNSNLSSYWHCIYCYCKWELLLIRWWISSLPVANYTNGWYTGVKNLTYMMLLLRQSNLINPWSLESL